MTMKWILPYQGRDWVFDDTRITASEARLQKRLCNGATPAAASIARYELDPDATVAALIIARRRAGLDMAEAATVDDEQLDLTAVGEATERAAKAAVAPAPVVVESEPVAELPEKEVVAVAADLGVPVEVADEIVRAKRTRKPAN